MYQRYEFSILLYWQLHFTWYNFYDGKQQKDLRNIYIYMNWLFLFNMLIFPFIPRQNRVKPSVEWNSINNHVIGW